MDLGTKNPILFLDFPQGTIRDAIEDSITWHVRIVIPILPGDYSDLELKPVGRLEVKLVQAKELTNKDIIGKSDPFVVLYVRPIRARTKTSKTINNQLNPVWNEHFEFIVEDASTQHLVVKIFDDEGVQAAELIGCAQIRLNELEPGKVKDVWLKLVKDLDIQRDNKNRGQRSILLDIEGTTTPISFVTDILFPYTKNNVIKHFTGSYDSEATQEDISLLRSQIQSDLEQGVVGAIPVPPDYMGKDTVIASLAANVEAMIRTDRKAIALKQLQDHIWRSGFQSNELVGVVFDDVPEVLERWYASGIKVYIYSSGRREAQQLLFGNSSYGDLRKYICGYFDTTVGRKTEAQSYLEILRTVGVDRAEEMLLVTSVFQEAVAARAVGLEVAISIRPGNGPLPENHGFRTIDSLLEL